MLHLLQIKSPFNQTISRNCLHRVFKRKYFKDRGTLQVDRCTMKGNEAVITRGASQPTLRFKRKLCLLNREDEDEDEISITK